VEKASTSFFCTAVETDKPFTTRPMLVQKTGDDSSLWFLSANDSNKNKEITANPMVQLLSRALTIPIFYIFQALPPLVKTRIK